MSKESDTWLDLTVKTIADASTSNIDINTFESMLRFAFEAYAEMKTVKLKVALARCYEYEYEAKLCIDKDFPVSFRESKELEDLLKLTE